jgi:hypothetical protein
MTQGRTNKQEGDTMMKSVPTAAMAVALMLTASQAGAQQRSHSGLLTGVKKLDPITLSSGKPLAAKPYELEAGKYYRLKIVSDGTAELAISGADFFRNIWINEIVINEIEIRPLGVESLEFDNEGEAEISFVTIRPGTFTLRIPGTTAESQQAQFIVK